MRLAVSVLRAALAVRRLPQPGLPGAAGAGLRRAAALRLSGAERPAERAIDALRTRLRTSKDAVQLGPDGPEVRVARRYRAASPGPAWGRFLFGLVRGMRPEHVVEVGTGLGVRAAHLAAALALNEAEGGEHGRLVTVEGAPALAALAAGHLGRLGHGVGAEAVCRVQVEVGPVEAPVEPVGSADLLVIAGAAEAASALMALGPCLAPGALVVIDGVGRKGINRSAWRTLRAAAPGAPAVDLGRLGLIVHAPPEGAGDGPADLGGAATAAARETPSLHPTAGPA